MSDDDDELAYQRFRRHQDRLEAERAEEAQRAADHAELERLRAERTPPPPNPDEHEPEVSDA